MSDDWDIESYKTEYENEEHWELKKNFMLAHKDKFTEDELVCLAQVFANIEFLGCRYPDKTMIRVAELAKGVVETFREKRKDSLKRTFVAASDAASAKVKGRTTKGEENEPSAKVPKIDEEKTAHKKLSVEKDEKSNEGSRRSKYGGVRTFKIEQNDGADASTLEMNDEKEEFESETECETGDDKLANFVLFMFNEEEHPTNLIQMNASLNKCPIRWEVEGGLKTCRLYLNDQCVGVGMGKSVKAGKEEAARKAIAELRKSCYGVKVKASSEEVIAVQPSELGKSFDAPEPALEDNVGLKLMKLMGWQGGGLGNKEQGRTQPVTATVHVRKEGLGLKKNSFLQGPMKEFKKKAKEYIQSFAKSNSENNLVFSPEFTSDERKFMHTIAKSLGLKSKSYGKDSERHLVISKKPEPGKILQELLKLGGNSDKYELLPPTND